MKKKIAIVDDDTNILEILKDFLIRSEKFDIHTYNDANIALESIKKGRYDLVVLDIMMPNLGGIEFLKELKRVVPSAKVIMMTAYSTQNKMLECKKIGAEDYLTKPFISLRDIENKVLDNLDL